MSPADLAVRQWVERVVTGALRETEREHGPLTREWYGSAAKRAAGQLIGAGLIRPATTTEAD